MTAATMELTQSTGNALRLADARREWPSRMLVWSVIAAGAVVSITQWPTQFPNPTLVALLLASSMLLALLKLQLPLSNGHATISMAYAVDFAALLLCGADVAMVIAALAVVVQCSFRNAHPQPLVRTLYSVATVAVSVQAAGGIWWFLSGDLGPLGITTTVAPMLATATGYFVINTALIALAISLTAGTSPMRTWHSEFLWSAPSCILSAFAGTILAIVIAQGNYAMLLMAAAPVYVSLRAYRTSIDRIEAERRHASTLASMVVTTQQALSRATASEAALSAEKERVAQERTRLAITLKAINEAVITVDAAERVLLLNDSAAAMAQTASAEVIDQKVSSLFASIGVAPETYADTLDKLRNSREVIQARWVMDSPARVLDVTATPMRDADHRLAGVVWVLRDVTDATQMEYERSKAGRLESLGVLAGGLAHDFNNILMGVVGNLSIARTMVQDNPVLFERLCHAEAACVRARGVTAQLLTFSKGGAPVKTTASIEELVVECSRFALSGSSVAARFNVEPDLWTAQLDTVQISQVVHNIVLNAVQAMPNGGSIDISFRNVRVPGAADVPDLPTGIYVCVSFHDQGPGIPADQLGHIFEPYFTTKQMGSGLGLAISSSIVRAHGGALAVSSSPEMIGARFDVYLPATCIRLTSPVIALPTPEVRHNGSVLLMDDDAAVSEVASDMLQSLGYTTTAAFHGQDAIDRVAAAEAAGTQYDLIILDLTVPGGMGGKETVPHLRALNPNLAIVVTSGYADNGVLSDYATYGFDGVLPKPFSIADLRVTIEQTLVRRQLPIAMARRLSAECGRETAPC
jgi:PAS domain S-box-containing protein